MALADFVGQATSESYSKLIKEEKMKLAILDNKNSTLYTYSENELIRLNFYKEWVEEFISDEEGIRAFIETVLDFNLNDINYLLCVDHITN